MAFGTSGKNDQAGIVGRLCETPQNLSGSQEHRNRCGGVCVKRLASRRAALQFRAIKLGIDLSAQSRWLRFRDAGVQVQALFFRRGCSSQPDVLFQS